MRHPSLLLSVLLLGACSLISPYTITFTNTPDEVVDPATSTLDFVVSVPTLAYISGVSCEGADPMDLLPVESKDMEASAAHKLPLTLMKDQPAGAKCQVTVTAYDKTTTESASASIELMMAGTPVAKAGELCGGIAAIQCAEGLTCNITDTTVADASGTCVEASTPAPTEDQNPANSDATTGVTTDTSTSSTTTVTPQTDMPTINGSTDSSGSATTGGDTSTSSGSGGDATTPQNW